MEDWKKYIAQTSPWGLGLEVAEARGSTITAIQGGRAVKFIDFISGIGVANSGHLHPAVRSAVHYQIERYAHTMVYGEHNQDIQVEYAKEILEYFPEGSQIFFTNSGTESMELALKIAIKVRKTGSHNPTFVTIKNGFHGRTFGAMAVSSNIKYKMGLPQVLQTIEVDPEDEKTWRVARVPLTAFVLELCQGEAGARLLPRGLVNWIVGLRKDWGVPIIVDEVQTGFGRTGTMFLQEQYGLVPDITTLGKAIGGGLPLGGVVTAREDFEELQEPPFSHVTTFGGNPISCAAGQASFNVIKGMLNEGRVVSLSSSLETYLHYLVYLFPEVLARHSGIGLLRALHFTRPEYAEQFVKGCFEEKVLVGYKLNNSTAVRLAPPLIMTDSEFEGVAQVFKSVLSKVKQVGE